MLLAIISDTHDNIVRLDQALQIIKEREIKTIIHCGDVTSLETIKHLSKKFDGQIYLSLGNVDETHGLTKKDIHLKNVSVFKSFGEYETSGTKIAFTHFLETAKELALTNKYSFIFYGHTHKPWEETINNVKIINPGTLAGIFSRSTFAIFNIDTKELELKIM